VRMIGRPCTASTCRLAVVLVVLMSIVLSACGSRLSGVALQVAKGAIGGSGNASDRSAAGTSSAGAAGSAGSAATNGSVTGSAITGSAGVASSANSATAASDAGGTSASCNASNNGGATDTGVTANSIIIGNIASISGVAPGLTQSAQNATEAFADYVNSQGGICGRQIKVQPFDDGNDAGTNAADAQQACQSDFALVGDASGFDNGGASAIQSCGIPDLAAEVSTTELANVATAFGTSDAHYWPLGPPIWLKSHYPDAVTHAGMIYLDVPATIEVATSEMQAYETVGFNYVYTAEVSPTEPNYAPYVAKMQSAGVQYVTEISDDNSAARLVQSMAQANYQPQVVDWFSEEYTQHFLTESQGDANGNLVLMETASYEEGSSNPGFELYSSWLNRVAPGTTHDIFGPLAWSAGLAFLRAAKAAGAHLTRAALLAQLQQIGQWNGGGVVPPSENYGQKVPTPCFAYFKISGDSFVRVYPAATNSFDCTTGGLYKH